MLKSCRALGLRATAPLRVWAAEDDDPNAPPTTFKNVKPGRLLRLWRQVRQRAWVAFTWDEEWTSPGSEGYLHQQRLEQVCFAPLSAYGMVPGSYCDPLLYNTKHTSPFRWHVANTASDIVGHWYMEADEIFRIKDWQPKNPDDPTEMFPRPPQQILKWDETVDEHGNRTFRYKYRYDFMGPTGMWEAYPRYPFSHLYLNGQDHHGRAEGYGFKQGHLLRCSEEEEEVLRRIMEEEDKEWEMVKRTEVVQEPWSYPGKIRPQDFKGAVERAKARFREQIRQGKETDPSEDPDYDLVQAGEYVEPRDGPRAEWRHLWTSNRAKGEPLPYQVTFNDGITFEDNEGKPPVHPASHYEVTPKEAPYKRYEEEDTKEEEEKERRLKEEWKKSMEEAISRHEQNFGPGGGRDRSPVSGAAESLGARKQVDGTRGDGSDDGNSSDGGSNRKQ
ncbi:hypothetical protein ERJ75_001764600 [Trypanosoma vivax]|nr:hypothetical protein TRVL_04722 [Trypanosoma vivax]KAH8604012.1 hypothetical protein ERJ75_001764600 [Trypanosoma vivax]